MNFRDGAKSSKIRGKKGTSPNPEGTFQKIKER